MAAFDPIETVSGNQPSSLAGPSLVQEEAPNIVDQSAQIRQPMTDEDRSQLIAQNDVPQQGAPIGEVGIEDPFFSGVAAEAATAMDSDPFFEGLNDAPTVEIPSIQELSDKVGVVEAVKQKVSQSASRLRLGFAGNDKEQLAALKKQFGEKNARMKGGKVQFNWPKVGFVDFDPDEAEFNDLLDLGRIGFEAAIEEGGQAGVALATGGPLGIAAGAKSGAVTAPLALLAGDFMAETVFDIERDPDRNRTQELGVASAFGMGSGAFTGMLTRNKMAKERAKGLLSPEIALEKATEVERKANLLNERLAEYGVSLKVDGNDFILSPGQQMGKDMPEGPMLDFNLSDNDAVREFFIQQGIRVEDAFEALIQSSVNSTGRSADELFGAVKKASKHNTGLYLDMIGTYRNQAKAITKGKPKAVANTMEGLDDSLARFGGQRLQKRNAITSQVEEVAVFDKEAAKRLFRDASDDQVGDAVLIMSEMTTQLKKNGGDALTLQQTDDLYMAMTGFINDNIDTKNGRKLAKKMIDVKDRLRDDWTQQIGSELTGSLPAYKNALKKASDMMTAQKGLKNLLKQDDFAAQSFANRIFSGDLGKQKLKQMKTLISHESPELWDQLRGTYLNDIISRHREAGKAVGREEAGRQVNWKAVRAEYTKLRRTGVAEELLNGDKKLVNSFNDLLNVASAIDHKMAFKPKEGSAKGFGKLVRALGIAWMQVSDVSKLTEGQKLLNSLGQKKALKSFLAGEGAQILIKTGKTAEERAGLAAFVAAATEKTFAGTKSLGRTGTRKELEQFGPNAPLEEEQ